MTKRDKLLQRFKSKPPMFLHKPHPIAVLKRYQVEQILDFLKKEGVL